MTDQPVEIDATACRLLWAEVFLASVADAWNDPLDRWVGTRDFYTVAALAGLDHDVAQDLAVALGRQHARLRAEGAEPERTRVRNLPAGILRRAL